MIATIPPLFRKYYHRLTWEITTKENEVFLTFDDGPIPEITPWVLDILKAYNAKATFFCIGENVEKYPELLKRIIDEGHALGNHTHNHVKGWKTTKKKYVENIAKANHLIQSNLLRPPYGRITKSQISALASDYHIIMWTILSGDYNPKQSPESCFKNVKNNLKNGAIVVFHDSIKAEKNMKYALCHTLEFLKLNKMFSSAIRLK